MSGLKAFRKCTKCFQSSSEREREKERKCILGLMKTTLVTTCSFDSNVQKKVINKQTAGAKDLNILCWMHLPNPQRLTHPEAGPGSKYDVKVLISEYLHHVDLMTEQ